MNWFININSKNIGPITEEDLYNRLKRGEIGPLTPVWREGMANWVQLAGSELMLRAGSSLPATVQSSLPEKNMFQYYTHVLKNYAAFNGRARRSEYWFFFLCNLIVSCCLIAVGSMTHMIWLDGVYRLAVMVPIFAVAIRRMHDVDKSGWYMWIPIYNIVLACRAGTAGSNRFGPDPKSPEPKAPTQSESMPSAQKAA